MNGTTFDPKPYLKPLNGRQYLEVVHRLQWIRAEHPDAAITTRLEQVDFTAGWAIFHARVEIPGKGVAEGTGSETRQSFPAGWLEKAETIAVGRALAMLGYGTAWALDFDTAETGNGHLADTPLAPATVPAEPTPIRPNSTPAGNLASPAQVKLIYLAGKREGRMQDSELEEWVRDRFGRDPLHLTRTEASAAIDQLKAIGSARR